MTEEEFISQIREKYPDGFLQNPRDNYQAQKLNSEGLSYEGYCLVSVSKLDSYDSISMFNSFQGGDGVEKFAVSVNLKTIRVFFTNLANEFFFCHAATFLRGLETLNSHSTG